MRMNKASLVLAALAYDLFSVDAQGQQPLQEEEHGNLRHLASRRYCTPPGCSKKGAFCKYDAEWGWSNCETCDGLNFREECFGLALNSNAKRDCARSCFPCSINPCSDGEYCHDNNEGCYSCEDSNFTSCSEEEQQSICKRLPVIGECACLATEASSSPSESPLASPSDAPSEKPSASPSNWHHDNVELGTAGNFAILTKSGVTTTGTTSVTGSIGTSPIAGTALTGFALTLDDTGTHSTSTIVNGFVFAADHGSLTPDMMTIAISDMEAAYVDAAGRAGPDVVVGLGAGDLSGLTLGPGIYKWSTNVGVTTDVTFEGTSTDVWIIQITGTFTAGPDASIILSGDAKAENIYWAIADVVHFDDRSHGEGIFLAQTMISFNEGSSLHGAALAQTAVTMIATNITGALTPSSFYIEV